jgi:hypothetical protein
MSTLFESAINTAITKKEEELDEQNKGEIAEFKDDLVTKLDEYLTYFVEEFTRENEQQIEDAVKVKTASRVLDVFEGVVQEFNIQLDEKVVEESEELATAKTTINEQTEELLTLRKEKTDMEATAVVESMTDGFESDAQQEKFRKLAETVTFTDSEEYKRKLTVLAESVKDAGAPTPQPLEEDLDDTTDPDTPVVSPMANYLKRL